MFVSALTRLEAVNPQYPHPLIQESFLNSELLVFVVIPWFFVCFFLQSPLSPVLNLYCLSSIHFLFHLSSFLFYFNFSPSSCGKAL